MRIHAILLALVACSKAEPSPAPTPPGPSASAAATAPGTLSAMDLCKRLATRGAVQHCTSAEAAVTVHFEVGTTGQGSVLVAPTVEGYQRMIAVRSMAGGFQTATSATARAFVFWSGGDDTTAATIKATLAELDAK